jgi:WD40 repeat protein
VKLWETKTGREILTLSHPAGVDCVAFTPDTHRLVSTCRDGRIRLWDATPLPFEQAEVERRGKK